MEALVCLLSLAFSCCKTIFPFTFNGRLEKIQQPGVVNRSESKPAKTSKTDARQESKLRLYVCESGLNDFCDSSPLVIPFVKSFCNSPYLQESNLNDHTFNSHNQAD